MDASRRTTGANAYVNGLGHTKRVVLYDNLIDDFPDDQVRSVVAHELGHQQHHDIYRGPALARPRGAGGHLPGAGAGRADRRAGRAAARKPGPTPCRSLLVSLAIVSFLLGSASNALSRRVEASADAFSLQLTRDPAARSRFSAGWR